jgi:hypothetical protein
MDVYQFFDEIVLIHLFDENANMLLHGLWSNFIILSNVYKILIKKIFPWYS